jgi:cytoskeleton protein RodZ
MVIAGSLFGVLVLIGFIAFVMFPEAAKNEIAPVPEELTKSQLNEAPALVGDALPVDAVQQPANAKPAAKEPAAETETPAKPANRIVLEITDASWVEIRNASGSAILRQVLKPGDVYFVPDEEGLVMATGNAGGITVKVDGKPIKPLGETGQIRRKISLDPVALLKP